MREMHEAEKQQFLSTAIPCHCESCIIRILHVTMTLDEFLDKQGLSGAQFAERIGVDPATIYRIRTGRTFPHRRTMRAIIRETSGEVTANDLVGLQTKETTD